MADTETLDRLYLEWSQFTQARTAREIAMRDALQELLYQIDHAAMPGTVRRIKAAIDKADGRS